MSCNFLTIVLKVKNRMFLSVVVVCPCDCMADLQLLGAAAVQHHKRDLTPDG